MSDDKTLEMVSTDLIESLVYTIRGQQVMLDVDLAHLYGYEVKRLNEQVKRNKERFPEDFMFRLTEEEVPDSLRSQFATLNEDGNRRGAHRKYLPYVFTEQGVNMLATVLKSEIAIKQSITIMRAFRGMRHYIRQNQQLLPYDELKRMEARHYQLSDKVQHIEEEMVTKSDLSNLMKLFDSEVKSEEILILNGEPFKADAAYQKIYKKAKKNIVMVDDYIGVKTLQHLACVGTGIDITLISDNKGYNPLRLSEYIDFQTEYPGMTVSFLHTSNKAHDRYIVLDYGTRTMKVYHCGASSKDAGKKITTITEIKEVKLYKDIVGDLLTNPQLSLT